MTEEKKPLNDPKNMEALRNTLKTLEGEEGEALTFLQKNKAASPLFSFAIPDDFHCAYQANDFEVICYQGDPDISPLIISLKAEPLLLLSPEEHFTEVKNSILGTKGMTMTQHTVGEKTYPRFDIPTLGGRQMFFPLYHTTELFSLRISFAKKIPNADEVTDRIIDSFAFQDFTPRIHKGAVASICNVFERNRSIFRESFTAGQENAEDTAAMAALCEGYANALWGCLRVLDEEIRSLKQYDLTAEDFDALCRLGEDFCEDMNFAVDFQGETFSVDTEQARAMVKSWR